MIKNVIILALNDIASAIKNKSVWLVIFIPLFVVISMKLTGRPGLQSQKLNIGLAGNESYPPLIVKSITSAPSGLFTVSRVTLEKGKQQLKEKKLDGLLLPDKSDPGSVTLLVLKKDSLQAFSIVNGMSELQKAAAGIKRGWISGIKPIQEHTTQTQTLPTWILMVILLVGCIILPAQVAEEKEKKLLLGIMQTPASEIEWLAAKLILGLVLSCLAVGTLFASGGVNPLAAGQGGMLFILTGSVCFSSFGIMLGFLCRNQASARTLGFIFYVTFLVPAALSDFSASLTKVSRYLPTYWLYNPVKAMLLESGRLADFPFDLMCLLAFGLAAFWASFYLLKRRWLM